MSRTLTPPDAASDPVAGPNMRVVPANQAAWEDLEAVLGTRGYNSDCWCQWFRTAGRDWDSRAVPPAARAEQLREQTACGRPDAAYTSGLVAYLDGEPVGWCAVEPRNAYVRLGRAPWVGRQEDRQDGGIWAVTCLVTRKGYRRRGVMRALAAAAVDFARERGARALEAYPMITVPGEEITWGELHVGSRGAFAAAGLVEVHRPSLRRVVMRRDF